MNPPSFVTRFARRSQNAVDAKRRLEAKQSELEEDAMESGRGDEPLLNKKNSWYSS